MNTAQFDLRSLSFPLSFLRPQVPSLSPPPSSHQHCPHPLLINTASHQPLLVRSVLIWSRPRISIGVVRSCIFRGWDICIGGWNEHVGLGTRRSRIGPARPGSESSTCSRLNRMTPTHEQPARSPSHLMTSSKAISLHFFSFLPPGTTGDLRPLLPFGLAKHPTICFRTFLR